MSIKETSFIEDRNWSEQECNTRCVETLKKYFGCDKVSVVPRGRVNKLGVDYICHTPNRTILVEQKSRRRGCSVHWKSEGGRKVPELTLERWSDEKNKVIGWTLDASKATDFVLFWFNSHDTTKCFILPFVQLRMTFNEMKDDWMSRYDTSETFTKETGAFGLAVMVPVNVVLDAMRETFQCRS